MVVFDLDGTIYFGDRVADGALELFDFLKSKGKDVVFYTNSTYRSREEIYQKLTNMGFRTSVDNVYTSSYATAVYARECNFSKVGLIGSESFKKELEAFELQVVKTGTDIDALVIGLDLQFNYELLAWAVNLYHKSGCKIIASNMDANYPSQEGRIMPGCGAIVAAVASACEAKIDFVVGKPNTFMMDLLISSRGYKESQIMIIGDSYASDIQMAINCKCRSVFISNRSDEIPNTIICNNLSKVKDLFV